MSDEEGQVSAVADKVIITQGKYLASAVKPEQYPELQRKEVVFIGRSNVGKSSLINSLTRVRNLARVSSQPGKTQTINFYEIGAKIQDVPERQDFYLVDLPGYGYAKVSQAEKERWARLMETYFQDGADAITAGVLIVDIRHKPTENDRVMHSWFRESGCPEIIVANKIDKLKRSQVEPALALIRETLELTEEDILVPFSAEKGTGKEELIGLLNRACE